jgi:hypothetical protein
LLAGASPGYASGLGGHHVPFGSIVATDLDGDHRTDFATAGPSRRDGAGYVLDITFHLSSLETGVIAVRTASLAGHLSARDLDGDADRDLILESFDREPLAVVLNDGDGHFHQVDLADFRARLHTPDPASFDRSTGVFDPPETGESPASPVTFPDLTGSEPDLAVFRAAWVGDKPFLDLRHANWATRGPPASR